MTYEKKRVIEKETVTDDLHLKIKWQVNFFKGTFYFRSCGRIFCRTMLIRRGRHSTWSQMVIAKYHMWWKMCWAYFAAWFYCPVRTVHKFDPGFFSFRLLGKWEKSKFSWGRCIFTLFYTAVPHVTVLNCTAQLNGNAPLLYIAELGLLSLWVVNSGTIILPI